MAEKKKGLYSRKLKDVNKDGKKNFGDTWLGDLLGADGKAGVQGPGMKKSLKGARREDDKADTTAKKAKSSGKTKASDYKGSSDDAKAKRTAAAAKKTVDNTDNRRAARTNISKAPEAQKTTKKPAMPTSDSSPTRRSRQDPMSATSGNKRVPTTLASPKTADSKPKMSKQS